MLNKAWKLINKAFFFRKRKKTRKHRGSKKQKVDEPTKEKQEEQIDFLEEAKMLKERIEINAEAVKKQFSKWLLFNQAKSSMKRITS